MTNQQAQEKAMELAREVAQQCHSYDTDGAIARTLVEKLNLPALLMAQEERDSLKRELEEVKEVGQQQLSKAEKECERLASKIAHDVAMLEDTIASQKSINEILRTHNALLRKVAEATSDSEAAIENALTAAKGGGAL